MPGYQLIRHWNSPLPRDLGTDLNARWSRAPHVVCTLLMGSANGNETPLTLRREWNWALVHGHSGSLLYRPPLSMCYGDDADKISRCKLWTNILRCVSKNQHGERLAKLEAIKNAICLHFLSYLLNICSKFEFLISHGSATTCLRWGG